MKLHACHSGCAPDGPYATELVNAAADEGLFVIVHTGHARLVGFYRQPGYGDPRDFVPHFERRKDATFILAHMNMAEPDVALDVARRRENVFVDTSWQKPATSAAPSRSSAASASSSRATGPSAATSSPARSAPSRSRGCPRECARADPAPERAEDLAGEDHRRALMDAELRRLERQRHVDPDAETRYLAACLRAGQLTRKRLRIAAKSKKRSDFLAKVVPGVVGVEPKVLGPN